MSRGKCSTSARCRSFFLGIPPNCLDLRFASSPLWRIVTVYRIDCRVRWICLDRASNELDGFNNALFDHGLHITEHEFCWLTHQQMQTKRRRAALCHPRHHALHELQSKGAATTLVGDVESCGGKSLTIIIYLSNKAGLLGQRPGSGIADGTFSGTHQIEDSQQSMRVKHAAHFAKEPAFIRDIHSHVDRISAIKMWRFERKRERAAMQEFRSVVEPGSASQTSGNEYEFLG